MALPTFFLSHGGGPCFFMDERDCFRGLRGLSKTSDSAQFYRDLGKRLRRDHGDSIRAVLVVTAHWETRGGVRVSASPSTSLYYDYGGFPKYTYDLEYNAPGEPGVAGEVRGLLEGAGVRCEPDTERGLDHGVFLPLKLMFPEADVPVVALSLDRSLDLALHQRLGEALAPLRERGVLVIGSGSTSHNFEDLVRGSPGDAPAPYIQAFHDYVDAALKLPAAERRERLVDIERRFADFRRIHPRHEHYLPIVVAAAAAGDDPGRIVHDKIHAAYFDLSSWQFGGGE